MKIDLLVIITLAIAFFLSVVPLPEWMLLARPEFPLLVLLYWVLAMPHRYGIIAAAVVGFFQDALTGALFGKHVLMYVLAAAVMVIGYRQIRMFGAWQQALLVGLTLLFIQFVGLMIVRTSQPVLQPAMWIFLPVLSGTLLWPWLMIFLRGLRRRMGIVNRFS